MTHDRTKDPSPPKGKKHVHFRKSSLRIIHTTAWKYKVIVVVVPFVCGVNVGDLLCGTSIASIESIESIKSIESIESVESSDSIESIESIQSIEPIESIEL